MHEHRIRKTGLLEDTCPHCGDERLHTWEDAAIVVCFTCEWTIDKAAWAAAWGSIE